MRPYHTRWLNLSVSSVSVHHQSRCIVCLSALSASWCTRNAEHDWPQAANISAAAQPAALQPYISAAAQPPWALSCPLAGHLSVFACCPPNFCSFSVCVCVCVQVRIALLQLTSLTGAVFQTTDSKVLLRTSDTIFSPSSPAYHSVAFGEAWSPFSRPPFLHNAASQHQFLGSICSGCMDILVNNTNLAACLPSERVDVVL